MFYSKTTQYAIDALVHLAGLPSGECLGVQEMAGELGIPQHFLGKILQDLRRSEFVYSIRGRHGGYSLEENPEDISLYAVMDRMEDIAEYETCLFEDSECSMDLECAVVCHWSGVKFHLMTFLRSHTIADLREVLDYKLALQEES